MVSKEMGVWYKKPNTPYMNLICNSSTISYTTEFDMIRRRPWSDMKGTHYKIGPEELVTW